MTMDGNATGSLGAIVLANGLADKLASKVGVTHKALLDIAGEPMVLRVKQAVDACPRVGHSIIACLKDGPVAEALRDRAEVVEAEGGSFLNGIERGFEAMPEARQVILATCDMPLLSPVAVSDFAGQVLDSPEMDLVYAMVDIRLVHKAYPDAHRTAIRLREGSYTAAGLCAVSRHFVANCGDTLMAAFAARKSKVAMGRLLGWSFLARFALGTLSVADIVKRGEELLSCRCRAVHLPYPECGFDVDTLGDLESARGAYARRNDGQA
jgi:molybdopterin-guanine dinucleotide biosynthesis protein A